MADLKINEVKNTSIHSEDKTPSAETLNENNENNEVEVDIESMLSNSNNPEELDKILNYLSTLIDSGVLLKSTDGTSIDKEMLNKLESVSKNAYVSTDIDIDIDIDIKTTTTAQSSMSNETIKTDILDKSLNKEKETLDSNNLKEGLSNIKGLETENKNFESAKMASSQKNELIREQLVNGTKTAESLNSEKSTLGKLTLSDGVVTLSSANGSISMDNANIIGVRGNETFVDDARDFADRSGYKENEQQKDQGSRDDREGHENEKEEEGIFFSGD